MTTSTTPTAAHTAASANTPATGSANNSTFDGFYNASISNSIGSSAQSGSASVQSNTTGGNAGSGNAADSATIINLLQSASSLGAGSVGTFTDNINGNVTSNLLLDPVALQTTSQPNSTNGTITVNTSSSGQINNNVTLAADSGNASVTNNTTAGNATSGNADAIANLVNLIDSNIAAKQSFLGTINIYGNLTGNILVPSSLLNTLLSTNNSPSATPSDATSTVSNTTDQTINNNLTTTAASGAANVSDNTTGGAAQSGAATTNVTVFNLTGSQIVGSNSLLVFVNVLGKWVGLIMDAPAGTTAAAIGGGITTDVPSGPINSSITNSTKEQINNNVAIAADSGNARVNHNTNAGNATSGNASAGANVLNLEDSNLSLTNWFGVLFINVFGSWIGSLENSTNPSTGVSSPLNSVKPSDIKAIAAFHFVPQNSHSGTRYVLTPAGATVSPSTQTTTAMNTSPSQAAGSGPTTSTAVLTSASHINSKPSTLVSFTTKAATILPTNPPAKNFTFYWVPLAVGLTGIGVLGIEQAYSRNRRSAYQAVVRILIGAKGQRK